MKSVIYQAFSQKEAKEFDVQLPGARQAEAFVTAFLKRSMPRMSQQACEEHLQRKAVVLEYSARRKRKEKKKKSKGLSARQRRELRLFDIKPEQQSYNLFLPLHELWKQYIRDLCGGLKPDTQPQMIQAKLLKADLHGALVSGKLPKSTWRMRHPMSTRTRDVTGDAICEPCAPATPAESWSVSVWGLRVRASSGARGLSTIDFDERSSDGLGLLKKVKRV
ncbi:ribonuclease P protein subunit p29-like [Crocuta crocuta]